MYTKLQFVDNMMMYFHLEKSSNPFPFFSNVEKSIELIVCKTIKDD